MSATRVRSVCPTHEVGGCEALAEAILQGGTPRDLLRQAMEERLWQNARARFRERDLAEKISLFEVADCWRHGESPRPSMERSVFLWQSFIAREPVAGAAAKVACPVAREFFEAQRTARVSVVANHGGICLRDALVERPSVRFVDSWPKSITALAKPDDRFLVRMPLFRGQPLLDELGISRIVLEAAMIPAVQQLAAEAHLAHGTPDWPWHLTAIWTTVATEDWARTSLGATPGPSTRH